MSAADPNIVSVAVTARQSTEDTMNELENEVLQALWAIFPGVPVGKIRNGFIVRKIAATDPRVASLKRFMRVGRDITTSSDGDEPNVMISTAHAREWIGDLVQLAPAIQQPVRAASVATTAGSAPLAARPGAAVSVSALTPPVSGDPYRTPVKSALQPRRLVADPNPPLVTSAAEVDTVAAALSQLNVQDAPQAANVARATMEAEIKKKTADVRAKGPAELGRLGRGLATSIVAQSSADDFFTATEISRPAGGDFTTNLLDELRKLREDAAFKYMQPEGEWKKFTREMKSMAERRPSHASAAAASSAFAFSQTALPTSTSLGTLSAAAPPFSGPVMPSGGQVTTLPGGAQVVLESTASTHGRLRVEIGHTPRRTLPSEISSAVALWDYCQEHDANECAEMLHAFDAEKTPGDVLDPSVAAIAQMVVFRGLGKARRPISEENQTILSKAIGAPSNDWIALDDEMPTVARCVGFLADLPIVFGEPTEPKIAEFAQLFKLMQTAARHAVDNGRAVNHAIESDSASPLEINELHANEIRSLAALYRLTQDPRSHAAPELVTQLGYLWRAKMDCLVKRVMQELGGIPKQWIAGFKSLPSLDSAKRVGAILQPDKPSSVATPEIRLLVACVLVDSHYAGLSDAKRRQWRHMLQKSEAHMPLVRSFYFMSQFT